MKTSTTIIILMLFLASLSVKAQHPIIEKSRLATVKIVSNLAKSSGTGFFLNERQIATCFHVVANIEVQAQTVKYEIFQDLKVVLPNGDSIDAKCLTSPSQSSQEPLLYDFAIVQLTSAPQTRTEALPIVQRDGQEPVGSDVYFSGFPLATPAMVTHKGMLSGRSSDGKIICVQAAINKGNSGGALLNQDGQVIGIVSMREGGISQALLELGRFIESTEKQGSVQLMGVDPLQSTKEIIHVLDTYISTGIGYAISAKYLREYIAKHSR
jgi:S1-C subfamily serine protease